MLWLVLRVLRVLQVLLVLLLRGWMVAFPTTQVKPLDGDGSLM
jgi:hypothetical protein